ncbi:MAG: hypothetical protein Q9184_004860, partial [Pyrenodesmia sp. 2 TL-2023]
KLAGAQQVFLTWGMLGWFPTTLHSNEDSVHHKALALLSPQQIRDNTTRGTTPGLINPLLGEAAGRVIMPDSKMGAGKRRGQRAPGIRHGGGNHQQRYKEKAKSLKVQKRKVEFEDLEPSRAPKIARARSSGLVPGNSQPIGTYGAISEASLRQTIGSDHPTLKLGCCDSNGMPMTGEYAQITSPFYLPGSPHIDVITNDSPQLPAKKINTPTRAQRPMVDGAYSSGATIIHYEPSSSDDEEFNFNDYVNASDTASEGEGSAALTGSDRNWEPTHGARTLLYGLSWTLGVFASEPTSCLGQEIDQVQNQGHSGEPDHYLPPWYDDNLNHFALQKEDSSFPGLPSTDPTLSSFLDWDTQEFES